MVERAVGRCLRLFYRREWFTATSRGDADRYRAVLLNEDGEIDPSMLDLAAYVLLAGRSGGQTINGGTAASQSLKLRGTSHATPGDVRVLDRLAVGGDFQAIQVFKVVNDLGVANNIHEIGQLSHAQTGAGNAGVGIGYVANGTSRVAGYIRPTGNLPLRITNSAGASGIELTNDLKVSMGTASPQARLDVTAPDINTPAVVARGAVGQVAPVLEVVDGGISFGGSVLADYVQVGTWTPTVTGSSSNPTITYNQQDGEYTRIGNVVLYDISINIATYSGGSGTLQISLPFATTRSMRGTITGSLINFSGTPVTSAFLPVVSTAVGRLRTTADNGAFTDESVSAFQAGTVFQATGFYFV